MNNLTARFNVYLLTSNAPSVFKSGLTSIIPKLKNTKDPSKFRPITMSSLINKLFHKILAKRIENTIALDPRQKACIRRDSIAENMFLLKNIIYQYKQKLNPLQIYLLDVSKAFDSMSHDAIIAMSNRAGLPKTIIEYINNSYTDCKTQLKYKKGISPFIAVNRGVKQGNPMSHLLFNTVIYYAISDIPSSISIHNNSIVKYIAFADDLVLFAKDNYSLQAQVDHVLYRPKECGLDINSEKSTTLNIIINPKNIYLNSLKTMDRLIRSFVRRWLRLPKDTSLGVFYAPCGIGGLAITRIFLTIPVMRLRRINSIRGNDDPIIQIFPNNILYIIF